ncbi:phosphoglucomutase/phosphomannomutase, alpha/beta/alpha domain I family protein, partial [Escherichia coli 8.0566]
RRARGINQSTQHTGRQFPQRYS